MSDETRAVTITEAAERLSLHPHTVEKLVRGGNLRAVRVGRVWRVPLAALAEFLAGPQAQESAEVSR